MNMITLFTFLTKQSVELYDVGILIIRVGIGLIFIRHGYPKILAGTSEWQWLGSQMANLGITFAPLFWGFAAAWAEFFGGILLTCGLATRVASFFMACVMFVAFVMHVKKGDSWGYMSHPLALLVVFIGLMVCGSGRYSLDTYLYNYFSRL